MDLEKFNIEGTTSPVTGLCAFKQPEVNLVQKCNGNFELVNPIQVAQNSSCSKKLESESHV